MENLNFLVAGPSKSSKMSSIFASDLTAGAGFRSGNADDLKNVLILAVLAILTGFSFRFLGSSTSSSSSE